MLLKKLLTAIFLINLIIPAVGLTKPVANKIKLFTIATPKIAMVIDYNGKACITSLTINRQKMVTIDNKTISKKCDNDGNLIINGTSMGSSKNSV